MASYRSTRFGRFEINDGAALRFPDGVAGLAHLEWFAILKRRADSVFLWLQSLDDPDVALPIVLPWAFHWDYEIELPDADLRSLGVSSADQLSIYCLVDVGDEMRSATVDLAAPLVINDETHVARQLRHAGRRLLEPRSAVRGRDGRDAGLDARGGLGHGHRARAPRRLEARLASSALSTPMAANSRAR